MTSVLAVPFFAAAALLVASGASKLRRPRTASTALAAAGLPARGSIARSIGAVELAVGLGGLVHPGWFAIPLAALYLSFAAFLAYLLFAANGAETCGCIGSRDTPPSLLHVALNVAVAAAAIAIASRPPADVLAFARTLPFAGVPFAVGTLLVAYLAYLVVAYLPAAFFAYRRPEHEAGPH